MDFGAEARADVERTLREGRDSAERGIARARVLFFVVVLVLASGLIGVAIALQPEVRVLGSAVIPLSPAIGLAYALVVRGWADRNGYRRGPSEAIAALDLVAIAGMSLAIHRFAPQQAIAETFDRYVLALMLAIPLILGEMRVDAGFRTPLIAFAIVVYAATALATLGPERQQILAGGLVVLCGVIGRHVAENDRELLERMARGVVLRRFLPSAFAERVGSEGSDVAAALAPRQLTLTLLSADLRGFTAMSESLAPAEIVALLDEYHRAMLGAVDASGGMLDKFIGDGLLVVFGYPEPTSDAGASAAVRCAREMLDALAAVNVARAARGKAALAMGIGIHTGAVTAGTIGAGARGEFTVIGDAVNTASRLEGLTKTAGSPVLVSADCAARLDAASAAGLRELAPMSVKGKAEPVRVFAVGGVASAAPVASVAKS